jgi:exonuclease III
MKTCIICGKTKDESEFYKHKNYVSNGGIDKRCKECHNSICRKRLRDGHNKEKQRIITIERIKSGKAKENSKRMYQKYRDKFLARAKLKYAVETGKIKKEPCSVCGDVNSQAHHKDYSKPFDVMWLCMKHHKELHSIKD